MLIINQHGKQEALRGKTVLQLDIRSLLCYFNKGISSAFRITYGRDN